MLFILETSTIASLCEKNCLFHVTSLLVTYLLKMKRTEKGIRVEKNLSHVHVDLEGSIALPTSLLLIMHYTITTLGKRILINHRKMGSCK